MGSQNLKATTKAKLNYDPVELDPELMLQMAKEQPKTLASYSVSDAVSTYYLYMKYVHPFIFALCTIIPLGPDDVLRKGSGTLCEALLMTEAFHKSIIFPNKQISDDKKMTQDGHLLDSETYVGGHVEALESGVFRADIPCRFRVDPDTIGELKSKIQSTLAHTITVEMKMDLSELVNFDEACAEIEDKLNALISHPIFSEKPKIYHLDVGAMYPNIILTNRLQPPAIVTEENCLACVHNEPDAKCKRKMNWVWRGELIPASRGEYDQLMQQLEQEKFGKPPRPFHTLPREERSKIEKKRIQDYCRMAYSKLHITRMEDRTITVCQRENAFYVNTVLAFRDRRYDYKAMLKKAKAAAAAVPEDNVAEQKLAQSRVVLYESLQLAHKCILNSFYGYVMRRGSRWFSMEMAGIVCLTGANIITEARQIVEKIGRPLELDTDGIWCLLPSSFPDDVKLKTKGGKSVTVSYPGAILNELVKDKFTNHQYHNIDEGGSCTVTSENSIFFEVDGPYLAMILPASKEEGKKLKKRYAVFNFDGSLAELKGFEVKRRGELAMIKYFQSAVFKAFLKGSTLPEAYASVANEANYWMDILYSKGINLTNEELFELIGENRSMSRKLEDYGAQKSTSISTAKRLAEFLGDDMVKNAGLACRFIISNKPMDTPVTERTIPLAIFQAEPKITCHFLRKWTKDFSLTVDDIDIRELIDWNYYIERMASCIQKIITIPAALQGVPNPVPRVAHPKWLENKRREHVDMQAQRRITEMFKMVTPTTPAPVDTSTTTEDLPTRKRTLQHEETDGDSSGFWNRPLKGRKFSRTSKKISLPSRNIPDDYDLSKQRTIANDGFLHWLRFLKAKWEYKRKMRASFRNGPEDAQEMETSVSHYFGIQRSDPHCYIIQICETKFSGQFTVFIIMDGCLRRFNMIVPRIFYVDDIQERNIATAKPVQKVLPKMRQAIHLYEYSVDEEEFASRLNDFNAQMCSTRINGIYETQMPLLFNAFVQVGSTCIWHGSKNLASVSLDMFRRVDSSEAGYINMDSVRIAFLYEFSHGSRSVVGFFMPSIRVGYIIITNRVPVDVVNLDNLYKAELQKLIDRQSNDEVNPNYRQMTMNLIQVTSMKDANRQLQEVIKGMKLSPTDPLIFSVQSGRPPSQLTRDFPILSGFPQVWIRVNEPRNIINVLDWQNIMSKRAIQHFFNSNVQLKDLWFMAQNIGMPVGNIPEDITTVALDIFYARQLRHHNHVLWSSLSAAPDFGGKDLEDLRLGNDWETASFRQCSGCIYNKEAFEASNVVVELSIGALAVSALLHNSRISDAEGISEAVSYTSGNVAMSIEEAMLHRLALTNYDEMASASGAIRVLKEVFQKLVRDIASNRNELFADLLIMNMHRWLSDPNSLMYNPAVYSAVINLMRKLCLLLVREINRLGGSVIYCSFTKVILSTNKSTDTLAKAFVQSLLTSLVEKPMFSSLNIRVVEHYRMFLWIDSTNYAYIKCEDNKNADDDVTCEDIPVAVSFSMADGLPTKGGCAETFSNIIVGYLVLLYKNLQEDEPTEEEFEAYCNKILMDEVAPNLFEITMKMTGIHQELNVEEEENRPSNQQECDAPLDFVKCISKILSVNPRIANGVEALRGQLMRILQVDDAAPSSVWIPPSINVVLDHVFCKKCNQGSELNLCSKSDERQLPDGKLVFLCKECKNALPSSLVEEILTERVSKIILSFTLQDFRCVKCRKISATYLAKRCECSNSFERTIALTDLRLNLEVIGRIAKRHSLENLQYYLEEITRYTKLR
ncbi:DNA polymerase family B domain-containing protein [Ditylenchus destructor]|nr:DNA polymerase family B domain-containing protein [Ditylenchus destructor]